MPARLVALDEGPDIPLDHAMVAVGRHPQCDARLDSLRVSRHHCCMTPDHGEVIVRDLGSTNGIRINGQRVEFGRLRPGDELSIAHIRYRLDSGQGHEPTIVDTPRDRDRDPDYETGGLVVAAAVGALNGAAHSVRSSLPRDPGGHSPHGPDEFAEPVSVAPGEDENRLAAAVRELLPSGLAERCRIQVIVQVPGQGDKLLGTPADGEKLDACRPDSSH